jgi:DNA invertase Pin-like site-specific DNA recombinase
VGLTYSRVSTKGQDGDAQDLRCQQFLAGTHVPLDRAFADQFTGGGDFLQRPAMREMLAYIDASPAKSFVVVFDDLKRFARDTEFHIRLRHAFRSRDVLLACLNFNFDESPEGRFAEVVIAAQGELERLQNRRQVIQKTKARLERGYWAFAWKKGYDIVSTKEHGKLCVPNAEGQMLAEALNGFATGRFARQADFCRFLVERKFWRNFSAKKYLQQTSALLRDPFYCGDLEYQPWGVTRRRGHHKALITREVFARIQARLEPGRSSRIRRDLSDDFPLRGLVICAACHKNLTGGYSRGRSERYPYYFCCNRICPRYAKMFRRADLEKAFATTLQRNRLKQDVSRVVAVIFDRAWQEELEDWRGSVAVCVRERASLETEIAEYAVLARAATSVAVRKSYEAQIEKADVRLKQIANQDAINANLAVDYRTALGEAIRLLENPISAWVSADVVAKHRLFFLLFEGRLEYVAGEGFRTGVSLSSTRLFEEFSRTEPYLVQREPQSLNRLRDFLRKVWIYREVLAEPIREPPEEALAA